MNPNQHQHRLEDEGVKTCEGEDHESESLQGSEEFTSRPSNNVVEDGA